MKSMDDLERELAEYAGLISRLTALMLPVIRELDVAQVAMVDGSRSLTEWVAARLDVETSTARRLVDLARSHVPGIEEAMAAGMSVDRAAVTARLRAQGASDETVERSLVHDVAGVRRMIATHTTLTPDDEVDAHTGRYLHLQPSLDESTWKLWGQLAGIDGRIVDKAIRTEADTLPSDPEVTSGQERADALVSVCQTWLDGDSHTTSGPHAEIFIDATQAAGANGQQGVTVVGGPRVGPNTLAEILCSGTISVTVTDDQLGTVSTSRTSRTIPPAVRKAVLRRDGQACVIDGCAARTRLQPHHIVPWSDGGDHTPENLATLCWYHHHVVIHQQGRRLDPDTPAQRRRFLRTRAGP